MDNPKIIKIKGGTVINNGSGIFVLKKTQNFIVVSETEFHFFFKFKDSKYSIEKNQVDNVTFKDRTFKFHDLKKAEILNIFNNFKKLIHKAQEISKYISSKDIRFNDMSLHSIKELTVDLRDDYLILIAYRYTDEKGYHFRCEIPYKYLWDKNWKKTIKKDYGI